MVKSEMRTPAENWRRIGAYTIDSIVMSACYFLLWLESLMFEGSAEAPSAQGYSLSAIAAVFIFYFFYHWLFLYFLSATPGKLLMGLRVAPKHKTLDEGLGLLQSFLRVLADQLSWFFGHGLRMLVLMRLDRTHVSDWVAETEVIQLSPRQGPVKRHVFWAFILCLSLSSSSFMKIYSEFQRASLVGGRVFFEDKDNE